MLPSKIRAKMSATNSARQRKKKKAGHKHREKTLCCGPLVYEKPSTSTTNPAAQPIETTGLASTSTLSPATVHRNMRGNIPNAATGRTTSNCSHLDAPELLAMRAYLTQTKAKTHRATKHNMTNISMSEVITYKNQNTHRQLLANARKFPACALQPKFDGSPKRHHTQRHMRQHLKAHILGALKTAANRI